MSEEMGHDTKGTLPKRCTDHSCSHILFFGLFLLLLKEREESPLPTNTLLAWQQWGSYEDCASLYGPGLWALSTALLPGGALIFSLLPTATQIQPWS